MSFRNDPVLPFEALRPRFWEVAGKTAPPHYETPFKKFRYHEQLTDYEMAAAMEMPVEDYCALENGLVRVTAPDVMRFCHVVECHPLDLYVEPWGGVPLPQEIFQALLIMIDDGGYRSEDLQRAHTRLDQERHQAQVMLESNVDELKPLLSALGYSQDLRHFHAPLYTPADLSGLSADARRRFANEMVIDAGVDQPRIFIENCLNTYGLELERHMATHRMILNQFTERVARNQAVMEGLADKFYGENGATALVRLKGMIPPDPDGQAALKEDFIANPNIAWVMTDANRAILDQHGANREDLQIRARLLFNATVQSIKNAAEIRESKREELSLRAHKQWYRFQQWRNSLRTQRLLDWMENWAVLSQRAREDDSAPLQLGYRQGQIFPGPRG